MDHRSCPDDLLLAVQNLSALAVVTNTHNMHGLKSFLLEPPLLLTLLGPSVKNGLMGVRNLQPWYLDTC